MSEVTTQELMNQIADRLILDLDDNEIVCPTCNGLRFVLVQRGKHTYIESCRDCYNGKNYICKYCGKYSKTGSCDCVGAKNERILEEAQKEYVRFEKAEKINYKDYNGYFLWNERAIGKEDLDDELYWLIYDNKECPKYIYATTKEYISIGVDIEDEISERCSNDGYEDMESYLDMNNEKLQQAQKLVNEWVEEQGTALDIYYEDYNRVVLLDDIIEELRQKIIKRR